MRYFVVCTIVILFSGAVLAGDSEKLLDQGAAQASQEVKKLGDDLLASLRSKDMSQFISLFIKDKDVDEVIKSLDLPTDQRAQMKKRISGLSDKAAHSFKEAIGLAKDMGIDLEKAALSDVEVRVKRNEAGDYIMSWMIIRFTVENNDNDYIIEMNSACKLGDIWGFADTMRKSIHAAARAVKDPSYVKQLSDVDRLRIMTFPALIDAVSHRSPNVRVNASKTLTYLTGKLFGPDQAKWRSWWNKHYINDLTRVKKNAQEPKVWTSLARPEGLIIPPLIEAVTHDDLHARVRAARTLTLLTGKDFGKDPKRWRAWWLKHREEFSKKASPAK